MYRTLCLFLLLGLTACTVYYAVSVPGESKATEKAKIIAANFAFSDVRINTKRIGNPCPSFDKYSVLDTKFKEYTPGQFGQSAWSETWIIEACGMRWRVPVRFHPDGEGNTVISTENAYLIK
jgi:hypothetical protein